MEDCLAWLAIVNTLVVIVATLPLAVQRWRDMLWRKKREEAVVDDRQIDRGDCEEEEADASFVSEKRKSRSYVKYTLDGEGAFGKGRLVLAVIRKFVAQHPSVTYDELRKIFPARLKGIKSETAFWGCVNLKEDAIKLYKDTGKGRYFIGENETIALADGTEVAVSSQWGSDNIDTFIDEVRKHGFIIEPLS